jgi:K+-transporting ATPase KdpF subunit
VNFFLWSGHSVTGPQRTACEGFAVIWIAAAVVLLLFAYLLAALLRPEWF